MTHLMESNPLIRLGAVRGAMLVSGKRGNDVDERIWPTEGRFFAAAGRRYASLVVNQTTAQSMPSRQTRKTGQMGQTLLTLV